MFMGKVLSEEEMEKILQRDANEEFRYSSIWGVVEYLKYQRNLISLMWLRDVFTSLRLVIM